MRCQIKHKHYMENCLVSINVKGLQIKMTVIIKTMIYSATQF